MAKGIQVEQMAGRYRDAYSVAGSIVSTGTAAKWLSIAIGALSLLYGFFGEQGGSVVLIGIPGTGIAIMVYMLGTLIAAFGQAIYALVDSAVNTSPLMTDERKLEIICRLGPSEATGRYDVA